MDGLIVIVLVHEGEDSGYWAEAPDYPGCVTQGETLDEIRVNIREALDLTVATTSGTGYSGT